MRLLRGYAKLLQSPELSNLFFLRLVGTAGLAESYFAHETIEEQFAEGGLDDFTGKEIRSVEFKDFCFVVLLNMEQIESQAKFAQVS